MGPPVARADEEHALLAHRPELGSDGQQPVRLAKRSFRVA